MRGWALHHVHLVIVIDALLHGIMAGLLAYCWVLLIRLARLTHKHVKFPLYIMGAIMVYISWLLVRVCFDCMRHYAVWWNR